jgi:hypothetical protein
VFAQHSCSFNAPHGVYDLQRFIKFFQPAPMPKMKRPPLKYWNVAVIFAKRAGLRKDWQTTALPNMSLGWSAAK